MFKFNKNSKVEKAMPLSNEDCKLFLHHEKGQRKKRQERQRDRNILAV